VIDYAEDRAALRPVAVLLGVGMLVVLVAAAVLGGVTGQQGFLLVAAVALIVWIFSNSMYIFVNWPTGIRIDRDGVRIGNVRRPDANRRRPPAPSFQAYRIFTVPWAGVLSMRVVRDRHELKQLARTSRRAGTRGVRARAGQAVGFYLGMLTPPFLHAALVIEVDEQQATFPDFRGQQSLAIATSQTGTRSRTWVAPTRRPDQLAEAVATITSSPEWIARRMG
jgi:hypothetical protein